jgi:hypothetical protein
MVSNVTQTVRTDQIIGASSVGSEPIDGMDDLSAGFFAEGLRQESEGYYEETRPPFRGSLDRLPRHRGPMFALLALMLIPIGAGVAWGSNWQPPAQWRSWAASLIGSVSGNPGRGEQPETP